MSGDSNKEGPYPPPHWESQPPRGAYSLPQQALSYRGSSQSQPYQPSSSSSSSSAPAPGEMVTLPPPQHQQQHPELYRHPPPYDMYPAHPQDPHRGGSQQHLNYNQPAPRQRTAIACRYCRRRKIRCSGFEASEDGRCTNCQRFQQECIFTPVSSQAQAFVPAHTAYPHLRNGGGMPPQRGGRPIYPQQGPPAIYGAHGQPLNHMHQGPDPNYPPPPGYGMASSSNPYPGPGGYDDRGHPQHPYHNEQGRPSVSSGRRGSGGGYEYPDPTPLAPVSPSSTGATYNSAQHLTDQNQPYYSAASYARRSSPQSAYSFDARDSRSPQDTSSSASNHTYTAGLHPPLVLPGEDAHTPPPRDGNGGNGSAQRGPMSVRDLLGPEGQGGRSSADADMLNALNRRGM